MRLFFHKFPSPHWMEERVENLYSGGFHSVSLSQIRKVIHIVLAEACKSASFGFILRNDDLVLEAGFYLAAFDRFGGALQLREKMTFDEANQFFLELAEGTMRKEIEYYILQAKDKGCNPNEISCHFLSVRSRILQNLWNDRLSPYENANNMTPIL